MQNENTITTMTPPMMMIDNTRNNNNSSNSSSSDIETQKQRVIVTTTTTTPTTTESVCFYSTPPKPIQQQQYDNAHDFRLSVRKELYTGFTNGICPGKLQCNLVVLPKEYAFDFLVFCQRNPKSCPLIEVLTDRSSSSILVNSKLAKHADLKTDLPKYAIYKHGKLEKHVLNCTDEWPDNSVAFLLGCSFSFDYALQQAGVLSRTTTTDVCMYKTNIPCRSSGIFHGNMVVSMRLIPSDMVATEVEITSQYPHAHGAPVCVGCPASIGIDDLQSPDWGPAPPSVEKKRRDLIPVFHACGVTPQNVVVNCQEIPFCITHAPGHMFVTDLDANQVYP